MGFLVLDRLTKRFGAATAVEAVSLSVRQGEFVSLLGPSGCGKTTTLQMIGGFVEPTSGEIRLQGRDLAGIAPNRRGLGIVFQSYALFPHMTAAENIAFGLEMRGVPRPEREERVRQIVSLVGLDGMADRYPRRMSGGQQQRVALARALVIRPDLLLLDEPLSNLDAKLREEMQGELRDIQQRLGVTTILVTHDQAEAMALSDRIVVMRAGRIEQIETPVEAYERPSSRFVAGFLGRTNSLPGRVERDRLEIAGIAWPVPAGAPQGEVTVAVRPERVGFGAAGLPGQVRRRTFHGSQWLFEVESPAGAVEVLRPNDGAHLPEPGAAVCLTWGAADMRLLGGPLA